jgi:hypothetical protein
MRQHHEKSPLRGNGLRNYNSPNNPQALEITGLLGRFDVFLLGVLQDERV